MKLERRDQVAVITMQRTENRFNPDHLGELEGALDEVAAMEGHPAAVLTGEDKFFSKFSASLYNFYGPTEAAVSVTCWQCQPDNPGHVVPIGYPIANTQIHIVDRHLLPVPIGVHGEILIGGASVARGYLNQEELTRKSFIDDPFSQVPGARLFRTGDIARYHSDGSIEYLGRADHQTRRLRCMAENCRRSKG